MGSARSNPYNYGDDRILERRRVAITGSTDGGASPTLPRRSKSPARRSRNLPRKRLRLRSSRSRLRPPRIDSRLAEPKVSSQRLRHPDGRGPHSPVTRTNPRRPSPPAHRRRRQFFREAFAKACESHNIPVTKIKERELENTLKEKFRRNAARIRNKVQLLGRTVGPPWTTDQKTATLAALLLLSEKKPTRKKQT